MRFSNRQQKGGLNEYHANEPDTLLRLVKGTNLELGVTLAAFCGLERGEVCGLKRDAIDFERKAVTIRRTFEQTKADGSTMLGKRIGRKHSLHTERCRL